MCYRKVGYIVELGTNENIKDVQKKIYEALLYSKYPFIGTSACDHFKLFYDSNIMNIVVPKKLSIIKNSTSYEHVTLRELQKKLPFLDIFPQRDIIEFETSTGFDIPKDWYNE